jgi:hypothetical protein
MHGMGTWRVFLVVGCLLVAALVARPAEADDWLDCFRGGTAPDHPSGWRIQTHEPNSLGYTVDDSGQFMDFTVSVKFTFFEKCMHQWVNDRHSTLFAFTARLGQYFERPSSPVIGKRFNPELIFTHYNYAPTRHGYFEFAYAHESNGQSISSQASYQQAQTTFDKPQYADDYISRGWDFLRFTINSPEYLPFTPAQPVQLWFTGKWFLEQGLLQVMPEEYHAWENDPEGKPRKAVDGLTTGLRYRWNTGWPVLTGFKIDATYTTGYQDPFRYNTLRLEGGTKIVDVPVVLWWANGYNQDLVRYFNKTTYFGIAVVIENF